MRLETAILILLLNGCISTPIAFTRDSPEAIYPAGELSGPPFYFIGWKFKF